MKSINPQGARTSELTTAGLNHTDAADAKTFRNNSFFLVISLWKIHVKLLLEVKLLFLGEIYGVTVLRILSGYEIESYQQGKHINLCTNIPITKITNIWEFIG